MLFEVLSYLGIFRYGRDSNLVQEVYAGEHKIDGGVLSLPGLLPGQHYAIIGSVLNDGAYVYGEDTPLADEVFNGRVYALRGSKAFYDLVDEMAEWQANHAKDIDTPYTSESFGGYSYTKDANSSSVFKKFESRLSPWRKV